MRPHCVTINGAIVEGILERRQACVGAGGRPVELVWVAHVQSLVRPLVVVDAGEGIEASLLLEKILSGRLGGFLLQGQVHTFVPAVLLWMSRFDALDGDPQTQPPHGQFAQAEEGAGAGEGHTVVCCGWRAAGRSP